MCGFYWATLYNSFYNSYSRWVQSLRRIVTTVDKAIHCIRAQSTSVQSRVAEETNTEQDTCRQIPVVHEDDFPSTSAVFSRLLYKQHTREQSASHSSWVQTTKKTFQRPVLSCSGSLKSYNVSRLCYYKLLSSKNLSAFNSLFTTVILLFLSCGLYTVRKNKQLNMHHSDQK